MEHTYKYPRPSLTADCVLFGFGDGTMKVLLIQRKHDPFAGKWAFPGGFLDENEPPADAARRELKEETGVEGVDLVQFHTFGAPGRDPRGWTVSVAHLALVRLAGVHAKADDDAGDVGWFPVDAPPPLAFDHDRVLSAALAAARDRARTHPISRGAVPEPFAMSELRDVYEAVLGRSFDDDAFHRAALASGYLVPAGGVDLYRFDEAKYRDAEARGVGLEVR